MGAKGLCPSIALGLREYVDGYLSTLLEAEKDPHATLKVKDKNKFVQSGANKFSIFMISPVLSSRPSPLPTLISSLPPSPLPSFSSSSPGIKLVSNSAKKSSHSPSSIHLLIAIIWSSTAKMYFIPQRIFRDRFSLYFDSTY